MKPMTKREEDTLKAIKRYMELHHYPPTIKEIGQAIGVTSTSTVSRFLVQLQNKGYIRREESKPRALQVITHAS